MYINNTLDVRLPILEQFSLSIPHAVIKLIQRLKFLSLFLYMDLGHQHQQTLIFPCTV